MNVLCLLTTVTDAQIALMLMDRFCVSVMMDIPGMERFAKVKKII